MSSISSDLLEKMSGKPAPVFLPQEIPRAEAGTATKPQQQGTFTDYMTGWGHERALARNYMSSSLDSPVCLQTNVSFFLLLTLVMPFESLQTVSKKYLSPNHYTGKEKGAVSGQRQKFISVSTKIDSHHLDLVPLAVFVQTCECILSKPC